MVIPKQDDFFNVGNYRFPNAVEFYDNFAQGDEKGDGSPTFTLDSLIGDLVWDAPGKEGEYNFAFRVIEWRKVNGEWFKLGYVTRDMQVIIEETDNKRPIIEQLPPICVEVGTLIKDTVDGSDPDGDRVKMEAFGGPFEFLNSPAKYLPFPAEFKNSPSQLFFEWQTDCSHIRSRPYEIEFKITDLPDFGPRLVDFSNWKITIVPSAPKGLTASLLVGRKVDLNWDNYSCNNVEIIEIWRRIGSYDFEPEDCEFGISGYELIHENEGKDTDYIDTNSGKGLAPGSKYCYRLIAKFPLPEGGTSYASKEVCVIMEADAPIMTNVSIEKTGTKAGETLVSWHPPLSLDSILFPKPYKYILKRYDDFNSREACAKVLGALREMSRMMTELDGEDVAAYALHVVEWLEDTAGDVLGVLPTRIDALSEPEEDPRKAEISEQVEKLIKQRTVARTDKDWARADEIRDQLSDLGVVVTDTADGPVWDLV